MMNIWQLVLPIVAAVGSILLLVLVLGLGVLCLARRSGRNTPPR